MDDVIMTVFNSIALSSAVLKPTQDPAEQGRGVCMRGQNRGTTGQALLIHGRDLTVLNTLEEVCLLALVVLEDQGGHPPGHAGALSGTGRYLAYWDFSTFKTFCFISSLAAW